MRPVITRTNGVSIGLSGLLWLLATAASAQQPPQVQADQAMRGGGMTEERGLADEQARLHFRAGLGLYDAGRFLQAAEEFEEAYRLSQRPQLLFNAYVAYRDASDLAGAVRSLENYLRESQEVPDRVNLEARLRSMRDALTEQEARAAQLAENERRLAEQRAMAPRPEVWPWVVAAAGGAMVIGGAITGGLALGEADALVAACPNGECGARVDLDGRRSTAQTLAITTDVLLFGGAAVAATGVILGLVLSASGTSSSADAPEVSAACSPTGCAASLRARF
jgi:tetratricopeptide (TPR) repeat protein